MHWKKLVVQWYLPAAVYQHTEVGCVEASANLPMADRPTQNWEEEEGNKSLRSEGHSALPQDQAASQVD